MGANGKLLRRFLAARPNEAQRGPQTIKLIHVRSKIALGDISAKRHWTALQSEPDHPLFALMHPFQLNPEPCPRRHGPTRLSVR